MKLYFIIQMVISIIIGFSSGYIVTNIINGNLNSTGLTLVMVGFFLMGLFLGENKNTLDGNMPERKTDNYKDKS